MKKSAVVILLCSFVIIVFTVAVCILCFRLYYQGEKGQVNSIAVTLKDNGKGIDLDELVPMNDDEAENIKGYSFQIKNTGSADVKYQVLLEDVELSNKEGYSKSELLSRNQLRYELSLNGKVIMRDYMSTIENNIIHERSVPAGKSDVYELKVWISESAKNTKWSDKYYRYKVNIQTITEESK